MQYQGEVYYDWADVANSAPTRRSGNVTVSPPVMVVYNGIVLDVFRLLAENPLFLGQDVYDIILSRLGGDLTSALSATTELRGKAQCLEEIFKIGVVDPTTPGCIVSQILLYVSLVVIIGVVVIKWALAVVFYYSISTGLGDSSANVKRSHPLSKEPLAKSVSSNTFPSCDTDSVDAKDSSSASVIDGSMLARRVPNGMGGVKVDLFGPASVEGHQRDADSIMTAGTGVSSLVPNAMLRRRQLPEGWRSDLMHVILMVTCYSEGEDSMRQTIDSLALADYPDERKLILVVCDGIIHGSGNEKPTPDIVQDLIVPATDVINPIRFPDPPIEGSYVAIADGSKRENKAKVITGYAKTAYEIHHRRVPVICIVKVGNEEEQRQYKAGDLKKPGNRGKRDSQVIVMNFLQKVIFDDRLTDFEYDLFSKIWALTGVPPDTFEALLMVDADTKVYPDSLRHLVACMMRDHSVVGLCGETKIENKTSSWVTMIQVFEYHISHHLSKAFESIFGGVTCLPGCFCMYRIKAPKGPQGYYVPILANPDIVEQYSENVVDTLHKKNLLLLGEDR
ncbi:Chitin synthase, class 3, partial [Gonapodya sp. JEL0774]